MPHTAPEIRDALIRTLNEDEFATFCFDYFSDAIPDIPEKGAMGQKAQALVTWCIRRGQLAELEAKLLEIRPQAFTPSAPKTDTLPRRGLFFGRTDELGKVLRALGPNDRSWGIVLDGIGGIGKTTLAVEAAYQALDTRLFENVTFVSAKINRLDSGEIKTLQPVAQTLDGFINETARALGRSDIGKLDSAAKPRALIDALRSTRTLLIFDNLETLSKEEQEALTDVLRDLPNGCKAMLTSRRRGGEGAVWLRLDRLDDAAACDLINEACRKDGNLAAKFARAGNSTQALIDEAGGSPLALTNILGILRKRHSLSVSAAVDILRRKAEDSELLQFVFQEARKDLTANDEAALCALALFVPSADFEAWQAVAALTRPALEQVIDRLNMLSLLNLAEGAERYALHPLTRGFVERSMLNEEAVRQDTSHRFVGYWLSYAERYGGNRNDSYKTYPKLTAEWDNLWACIQLAWSMTTSINILPKLPDQTVVILDYIAAEQVIRLARALRQFLSFEGLWDERLALGCYGYAVGLVMQNAPDAGWGAYAVAWVYLNRSETVDAQLWAERAMHVWSNSNKREQAIGERMLGRVATQRRDFAEAEQRYHAALAVYRDFARHDDQAIVLKDLGELAQKQANYAEAEQYYREALTLAQKIDYVDGQATYLGNLAALALERKDYVQARVWLAQAMPLAQLIGRKSLIGSHKYDLAQVCEAEGKHDEALSLAQEAVAIYMQLGHQELAEAQAFLARLQA